MMLYGGYTAHSWCADAGRESVRKQNLKKNNERQQQQGSFALSFEELDVKQSWKKFWKQASMTIETMYTLSETKLITNEESKPLKDDLLKFPKIFVSAPAGKGRTALSSNFNREQFLKKDDLLTFWKNIENCFFGSRQMKKGNLALSFEELDRKQFLKEIRISEQRAIELNRTLKMELEMERKKHQFGLLLSSISFSADTMMEMFTFNIQHFDCQRTTGCLRPPIEELDREQKLKEVHARQQQQFEEYDPLKDDLLKFGNIENCLFGSWQIRKIKFALSFEELDRKQFLKEIRISEQRAIELNRTLKMELEMERKKHQFGLLLPSISFPAVTRMEMFTFNIQHVARQRTPGCFRQLIEELDRVQNLKEVNSRQQQQWDIEPPSIHVPVMDWGQMFIKLEKWSVVVTGTVNMFLVEFLLAITSCQFAEFEDELLELKKIDNVVQHQQNKRKTSKAESIIRSENDRLMCKICYIHELNVLFLPCSHVVACNMCAAKLQTCAVCRADIKEALPAYFN